MEWHPDLAVARGWSRWRAMLRRRNSVQKQGALCLAPGRVRAAAVRQAARAAPEAEVEVEAERLDRWIPARWEDSS